MDNRDPQLSELLKQWPDLEPRPAFTHDVLRRIRLEAAQPKPSVWWNVLSAWLAPTYRLAGVAAAVFMFTFAVGLWSAFRLPPPVGSSPAPTGTTFSVLSPGTLTGNYVAMAGDQNP